MTTWLSRWGHILAIAAEGSPRRRGRDDHGGVCRRHHRGRRVPRAVLAIVRSPTIRAALMHIITTALGTRG